MVKKTRFKKTIVNISLSFISVLIIILIFEVVLRTTHLFGARVSWSKPDPLLCYRFVPGSKYWSKKENDHPITGKINSYGWRDKEWSPQKSENIFRIAVIGDSYVQAIQVETDSTFLKLVENQFKKDFNFETELMNYGRSGFTQTEELLILKSDVVQFSPDMAVLCFLPSNDIADVSKGTAPNFERPFYSILQNGELILDTSFRETLGFKIKSFADYFKRKSALLSLIAERYTAYKKSRRINKRKSTIKENTLSKKIGGYLSLCTDNPNIKYIQSYRLNKILIKTMAEYCKEKDIKFMLICLPTQAYIPKTEKEYAAIDSTFDSNYFEDDLKDYAQELNIEYLGLQRIFREYYENTGINLYWGHWNYEGHKIVANALTNKLYSIIYQSNVKNALILTPSLQPAQNTNLLFR